MDNKNFNIEAEQKNKKRARYSLLTFVLLLCIIELVISNIQNINKTIHFKSKIKGLEQKRDEELNRNQDLKSEIKNFNSEATLESIARNNLKMAGKDEVLILINEPKVEQTQSDSDTDKKKDKNKTINE